jgi:actin-like ATPase involved in cell morphogenesis
VAKGLDLGTGNIVGAYLEGEDTFKYRSFRNIFVPIEKTPMVKGMLKKLGAPWVEMDGHIYALGQQALDLAAAFNSAPRRPMAKGVINPGETQALPILRAIIKEALGEPSKKGESVFYSVPGDPVDQKFNAVYHEGVFKKLLGELGYTPHPINEGNSVIYSELLDDNLSGFGVSFGAGMCNVCCSVVSIEAFKFSVACSGDYIDSNVATAKGISDVKALMAKEAIEDLRKPKNEVEEAIAFYYQHMLDYVAKHIKQALLNLPKLPDFPKPPKVVVAGGTSLPKGFLEVFEAALKAQELPIQLGKVVRAEDPLKAIAKGCLFAAINAED